MKRLALCLVVVVLAMVCSGQIVDGAITIDTVAVGNLGNTADGTGYGAVGYAYNIGKYEVTAGQYTAFLNAVASTDTYGLYDDRMWSNPIGCKIQQSDSSGTFSYFVADNYAQRPVSNVSWGDAARFSNWLHNGQPTGAQDNSTTEDGAYELNGANDDAALRSVTRENDAAWFIPTEDEWYKAAYYDGAGSVYYDYPTGSNSVPGNDLVNPDPGNNANFYDNGYAHIGGQYNTTEVGEFENSASPYGTFDQGGNLSEWNETPGSFQRTFAHDTYYRGVRGGAFGSSADQLHSSTRLYGDPTGGGTGRGFRVASRAEASVVPEPSTLVIWSLLALCGIGLGWRRRRKP